MELIEEIISLVDQKELTDFDTWKVIEIDHFGITKKDYRKILNAKIGKETSGLYAFFQDDKCLYIGKAKSIIDRLLNHHGSANEIKEPIKAKRWPAFFKKKKGVLKIRWIKIDDNNPMKGEILRRLVESILIERKKPEFENPLEDSSED